MAKETAPRWIVQLLGGFSVADPNGIPIRFRTRATDSIFAFLAWHAGTWFSRASLAQLGWPDGEPVKARQSLRMALNSIRSQADEILETDGDAVRLKKDHVWVDALAFLQERDWSLYTGAFLGSEGSAWNVNVAEELEDLYVSLVLEALSRPGVDLALLSEKALRICPHRLELRARNREVGRASRPAGQALPIQESRFVGRQQELHEIATVLPQARLVTLTGIGGIGKTRLAGQVCHQHQPDAWFVRLSDVPNAASVPRAVLDALNIRPSPARTDFEQLIYVLSSLKGLLVLDNYEHLLPDTNFVSSLLDRCPDLQLLITSQRTLDLDGEWEFPIGPMNQADSEALFVARAESFSPFHLEAGLSDLCARLDGLPLALELAARKARLFTPAEMMDQLSHRLDFLAREGKRNPRHASVRAALDWSFERLSETEQDLLLKLCVFRGGFTREAMERVCRAERGPEQLEQLINYAWVQVESRAESVRFRLLESVREYGLELITPSLEKELQRAHASYFLEIAEACMEASFSPREPELHRRVHEENANFEAVWQWCFENDSEAALCLAKDLNWYWILKGLSRIGEERIRLALNLAGEELRPVLAPAYQSAGNYKLFQGRYAEAEPFFHRATAIAREFNNTLSEGLAQGQLAYLHAELSHRDLALSHRETMLDCLHRFGDLNWLGTAYTLSALVENRVGEPQRAREAGQKSVAFYRQGGYPWGLASALNELAMAHLLLGDYEASVEAQLESIELKKASDAPRSLALSYVDLALAYHEQGHATEAAEQLRKAFDILADVGELKAYPVAFALAHTLLQKAGRAPAALAAANLASESLGSLPPTRMHVRLFPPSKSLSGATDVALVRKGLGGL